MAAACEALAKSVVGHSMHIAHQQRGHKNDTVLAMAPTLKSSNGSSLPFKKPAGEINTAFWGSIETMKLKSVVPAAASLGKALFQKIINQSAVTSPLPRTKQVGASLLPFHSSFQRQSSLFCSTVLYVWNIYLCTLWM